jgi:hypothetical protein
LLKALLYEDEFTDPADQDAFIDWAGETLHVMRKRFEKGF